MTIAQLRTSGRQNTRFSNRIPRDVTVEEVWIDDLHAEWISPSGGDPDKVVLHLHGGGYVTGGIDSHQAMCILMAQTLKMKILLPEYRLAPEHPFPAALEDARKAYRWLLAPRPTGFRFKNRSASPGGITRVTLRAGDAGNATIQVVGKGGLLDLPAPPLNRLLLSIQLKRLDVSEYWEARYTQPLINEVGRLRARAD